jgi:hypothetical protein
MQQNLSDRPDGKAPCRIMGILFLIAFLGHLAGCAEKDQEPIDTKSGGVLYVGIEVPFHGERRRISYR